MIGRTNPGPMGRARLSVPVGDVVAVHARVRSRASVRNDPAVKLPPEKIVVRRAVERARGVAVATVMKALLSDHRTNAPAATVAVAVPSQAPSANRVRKDRLKTPLFQ